MSVSAEDVMELSHALQQDLRAATGKLVQLRSMLAALNLPTGEELTCRQCGIRCAGPKTLEDHERNVHAKVPA